MVHIIIVLGCSKVLKYGTKEKYTPRSHAFGRLSKTVEVYNSIDDENKFIICSGGFGQANKMKDYLMRSNITEPHIFCEPYSKNTIENCIFSYDLLSKWSLSEPFVNNLIPPELRILYEPLELQEFNNVADLHLHIVTDDYHIKRSETIFRFFLERLPYSPKTFSCHGSLFLDYLSDPSENDKEEIQKAYLSDVNITNQYLKNSLIQYQKWNPTTKDYHERM